MRNYPDIFQGARTRELSAQRFTNLSTMRQRADSIRKQELKKSYLIDQVPNYNDVFKDLSNTNRQKYGEQVGYDKKLNNMTRDLQHLENYNRIPISTEAVKLRDARNQYWTKNNTIDYKYQVPSASRNIPTAPTADKLGSPIKPKNNKFDPNNFNRGKYPDTENAFKEHHPSKASNSIISNIDKVQQKIRALLGNK